MKIEQIKTDELIPYARNARTHSEQQVQQIAGSIREFGFTNPVLVDKDNGIIAGHGRVMAAQLLRLLDVPCIRLGHLTESQKKAYILADNKLALNAGWDEELLKIELTDLMDIDPALMAITGFSDDEFHDLIGIEPPAGDEDAEPQIDRADELQKEWGTANGQVWSLGDHRLMCGDSTSAEDVGRLMDGEKVGLLLTDPPYGVDYEGVVNDDAAGLPALLRGSFNLADKVMRDGAGYYICYPDIHAYEFISAVREAGWKQARPPVVLWIKDQFVFGRGDYHSQSEPILYGWKDGAAHHAVTDRTQSNVWNFPRPKYADGHPTMKPLELFARAIRNSSDPSDVVYEPFSGSGTTIIAAEQLGRKCYAMEISPGYVAVALQRFLDATGKNPELMK